MENIGLLAIKLVIRLVVDVFSQLKSLSAGTILELGIGEAIQPDWIVLDKDLRNKQPFWWICLKHCGAFSG